MSDIQRYRVSGTGSHEADDGRYVKCDDHMDAMTDADLTISKLQARIETLEEALLHYSNIQDRADVMRIIEND